MSIYASLDTPSEVQQPEPEFLSFKDWSQENESEVGGQAQNVGLYSDYVRETYLTSGRYDLDVEKDIRRNSAKILEHFDVEGPSEYTPSNRSFDTRYQLLQNTTSSVDDKEEYDTLNTYGAAFNIADGDGLAIAQQEDSEFVKKYRAAKSEVEKLTNDESKITRAKRRAVALGQVKFAEIIGVDENGEKDVRIEVGDGVEEGDLQKHILESIKAGTLSPENAYLAQAMLQINENTGRAYYKDEKKYEAQNAIASIFSGEDEEISYRYDDTVLDQLAQHFADVDQGKESDFDLDTLALGLSLDLGKSNATPEGMSYDTDTLKSALEAVGTNQAMARNKYKFYEDEEELGLNIRTTEDGGVFAHPSLLVNKRLYDTAVDQRRDTLSDYQIEQLETMRETNLAGRFADYNDLLLRSPETSEKWARYRADRQKNGDSNADILSDFLSDESNYNETKSRLYGVGASVVDGVGELFAFIPAMIGGERSKAYLAENAQQRADRRELAMVFGEEFGLGQDLAEAVVPMLLDLIATAVLVPFTGGASIGGFALKQGSKLTAKGAAQAIVSRSLIKKAGDTIEQSASKAMLNGLIRESVDPSEAVDLIKQYNRAVQSATPTNVAIGISAANRSGASTYGSVYNTLGYDENISPEDRHQAALGAGLFSAAFTGLITSGFSSMGRGGLEDLVAAGATRKQLQNAIQRIARTDDLSEGVFKNIVKDQLAKSMKQLGAKGVLKSLPAPIRSAVDEAQEEGIDSFINGIVEMAFTGDENTSFMDLLSQAGHGAIIGGILGGGMTATMGSSRRLIYGNEKLAGMAMNTAENDFIERVTSDLEASGSPMTSEIVGSLLRAGKGRLKIDVGGVPMDRSTVVDLVEGNVTTEQEALVKADKQKAEKLLKQLNEEVTPENVRRAVLGDFDIREDQQEFDKTSGEFQKWVDGVMSDAQREQALQQSEEKAAEVIRVAAEFASDKIRTGVDLSGRPETFEDVQRLDEAAERALQDDLQKWGSARLSGEFENGDLIPVLGPISRVIRNVIYEESLKKQANRANDAKGEPESHVLLNDEQIRDEITRRMRIAIPGYAPRIAAGPMRTIHQRLLPHPGLDDFERVKAFRLYQNKYGKPSSGMSADQDVAVATSALLSIGMRASEAFKGLDMPTISIAQAIINRKVNSVLESRGTVPSLVTSGKDIGTVAAEGLSVTDIAVGMVAAEAGGTVPKNWEAKAREIEASSTKTVKEVEPINLGADVKVSRGKVPKDGLRRVTADGKETNVYLTNPSRGEWQILVADEVALGPFRTRKEAEATMEDSIPELNKKGAGLIVERDVKPTPRQLIDATNKILGVPDTYEGLVRGDRPTKKEQKRFKKEQKTFAERNTFIPADAPVQEVKQLGDRLVGKKVELPEYAQKEVGVKEAVVKSLKLDDRGSVIIELEDPSGEGFGFSLRGDEVTFNDRPVSVTSKERYNARKKRAKREKADEGGDVVEVIDPKKKQAPTKKQAPQRQVATSTYQEEVIPEGSIPRYLTEYETKEVTRKVKEEYYTYDGEEMLLEDIRSLEGYDKKKEKKKSRMVNAAYEEVTYTVPVLTLGPDNLPILKSSTSSSSTITGITVEEAQDRATESYTFSVDAILRKLHRDISDTSLPQEHRDKAAKLLTAFAEKDYFPPDPYEAFLKDSVAIPPKKKITKPAENKQAQESPAPEEDPQTDPPTIDTEQLRSIEAAAEVALDELVEKNRAETNSGSTEHLPVDVEPGDAIDLKYVNSEGKEKIFLSGILLNIEEDGRTYILTEGMEFKVLGSEYKAVPAGAEGLLVSSDKRVQETLKRKRAERELKVARTERAKARAERRRIKKAKKKYDELVDEEGYWTQKALDEDIAGVVEANKQKVKLGRENYRLPQAFNAWVTEPPASPSTLAFYRNNLQNKQNDLELLERELFREASNATPREKKKLDTKIKHNRQKIGLITSVVAKADAVLAKYNKVAGDAAIPLSVSTTQSDKVYHLSPALFPLDEVGIRQFEIAEKLVRFGYPVSIRRGVTYGYPEAHKKTAHINAAIAEAISERYPQKNYTGREGYRTALGGAPIRESDNTAVFDNNPKHVEALLSRYTEVEIDETEFKDIPINPSIVVRKKYDDDGKIKRYAVDVRPPDPDSGLPRGESSVKEEGSASLVGVSVDTNYVDNLSNFNALIDMESFTSTPIKDGQVDKTVKDLKNEIYALYEEYAVAATRAANSVTPRETEAAQQAAVDEAVLKVKTPLTELLLPSTGRPLTSLGGGYYHVDQAARDFTVHAINELQLSLMSNALHNRGKKSKKGRAVVKDSDGGYKVNDRRAAVDTVMRFLRSSGKSDQEIAQTLSETYGIRVSKYEELGSSVVVDRVVLSFIRERLLKTAGGEPRHENQRDTFYKSAKKATDNLKAQLTRRSAHMIADATLSLDGMLEDALGGSGTDLPESAATLTQTVRKLRSGVSQEYAQRKRAESIEADDADYESQQDVGELAAEAAANLERRQDETVVSFQQLAEVMNLESLGGAGTADVYSMAENLYGIVLQSIETEPELREAVIDLYVAGPGADEVIEAGSLDNYSSDHLLTAISRWLSARSVDGDAETQRAMKFYNTLTEASNEIPGAETLRSFLSLFTDLGLTEYGDPTADKTLGKTLIERMQSKGGTQLTDTQAAIFIKAVGNKARRALLEISTSSETEEAANLINNEREADNLGLVQGDSNSVRDALRNIAGSDYYNAPQRALANTLLDNFDSVSGVEYRQANLTRSKFAGEYDPDNGGRVMINMRGSNGDSLGSVLTHEYGHALLSQTLAADPSTWTESQAAAIGKLTEVYEDLVKKVGPTTKARLVHSLSSLDEFVASLMSSQTFQDAIRPQLSPTEPSFLKRSINSILEFFGFRSSQEQEAYEALIDLAYAKGNPEPMSLRSLVNPAVLEALDDIDLALKRKTIWREQVKQMHGNRVLEEVPFGEDPEGYPPPDDYSPLPKGVFQGPIIEAIKQLGNVPSDVTVVLSESEDAAAWVDPSTGFMYVNPKFMGATVADIENNDARRALIASAVSHELRHVAALRSLTEKEFTDYMDSMTDEDVDDVAVEYYGDDYDSVMDKVRNDETEMIIHRRKMAEEKLEKMASEVERGTSVKQDEEFLKSNPNAIRAAVYYLRQRKNVLMNRINKQKSMSPTEAAAVKNITEELRSMKANFKASPMFSLAGIDDLEKAAYKFAQQTAIRTTGEDVVGQYVDDPFDSTTERVPSAPSKEDEIIAYRETIDEAAEQDDSGTEPTKTTREITDEGLAAMQKEADEATAREAEKDKQVPWVITKEGAEARETMARRAKRLGGYSKTQTKYLYTQLGQNPRVKKNYEGEETYDAFFDTLVLPVMESGAYRAPSQYLTKLIKGEFDPRVKRIMDFRRRTERSFGHIIEKYSSDIRDKVAALEDKTGINELIAAASGYIDPSLAPDTRSKIDAELEENLKKADLAPKKAVKDLAAQMMAEDPKLKEKRAKNKARHQIVRGQKQAAYDQHQDRVNRLMATTRNIAMDSRNKALDQLRQRSPELYASVRNLRNLTDKLSKEAGKMLGDSGHDQLRSVFDNNLGVYLTVSYKFFDDVDYRDQITGIDRKGNTVKQTEKTKATLKRADDFFADMGKQEYLNEYRLKYPDASEGAAQDYAAERMGARVKGTDHTFGEQLRMEYLARFEGGSASSDSVINDPELVQIIDGNLRRRKDMPPELRELLGQYGPEEGADLMLRSLSTVAGIYSSHKMLHDLKTQAQLSTNRDDWWLFSPEQLDEHFGNPDEKGSGHAPAWAAGFREIRIAKGNSSSFNPLQGYYVPTELADAIEHASTPSAINQSVGTARSMADNTMYYFAKATGLSMAVKTLGSVGHFMRNVASQPFMAIAQGRPNILPAMGKELGREARELLPKGMQKLLNAPDEVVEERRLKYINLGLLKNEVRAGTLRDLLKGNSTPTELQNQVFDAIKKGENKFTAGVDKLSKMLTDVEAATESYYKIALYEDTLATLQKAKEEGSGEIRGVPLANMKQADLEREAAEQVLRVTPSYDKTMPWVTEITKSGAGLMIAPFLRWKSEMVRTPVETAYLALQEIKSGNPVLKARGIQRMTGLATVSAITTILPVAISKMLGGIGEEEDRALRASMPEYLRNHSFFYFTVGGELKSMDLTYVNPFSQIGDPFVRAMAELRRGDLEAAAGKLFEVGIADIYLDDQILMSALLSAKNNKDSTTGRPIYTEGVDGVFESTYKRLKYVADNAFTPRLADDAIKVFKNYSGDYKLMEDHPLMPFLHGVLPARVHTIDVEQQARRFLYEQQQKYNTLSTSKFRMMSDKPMSDREIRNVYRDEVRDKIGLNQDIYDKITGFEGLGIPKARMAGMMKELRYGTQRTQLLMNQIMVKPSISPRFVQTLLQQPNYGLERLKVYREASLDYPGLIPIED